MNENNKKKDGKAEWKPIDFVIPVFAFALAVYYLYTLRDLPAIAKYYGGTISVLIMVCFAGFVFMFFRKKVFREFRKAAKDDGTAGKGKASPALVAVEILAITLLYVGAIKLLGYTVATFLYMCGVMFFLGRRGVGRILLPALAVTLIGYILFVVILNLNISLDSVSKSLKYLIRGWIF